MREILFRGKDIDTGNWKYGYYVNQYGAYEIYLPDGADGEYGFDRYHVNPETIGQYTGLVDKCGKRIFEGDIVEYQYQFGDGSHKSFRAEVKAGIKSFGSYHYVYGFCAHIEFGHLEHSKVIGNIHDNPELMKGGEE